MANSKKYIILAVIVLVIAGLIVSYLKIYRPLNPALGPVKGNIADMIESRDKPQVTENTKQDNVEVSGEAVNNTKFPLELPAGAEISIFADNVSNARFMAFDSEGVLYLSQTQSGRVVALPDQDHDGHADSVVEILAGLDRPHGLEFAFVKSNNSNIPISQGGDFKIALLPIPESIPSLQEAPVTTEAIEVKEYLYIAETGRVIRLEKTGPLSFGEPEVIVDNLPPGGNHFTRSLAISGGKLYVSIGSSCNVCEETDPHRAAVWQYDLDGSNGKVFATGLRNSVGLAFHPLSGKLWATENGRDLIGDDVPPDEINILSEGGFYGWPICYGQNIHDTNYDKKTYIRNPCQEPTELPAYVELPAHVAPLGMEFYSGEMFPQLKNDLLVALHGSWNRSVPVGYKIIRVKLNGEGYIGQEDFISGWLVKTDIAGVANYSSLGRPVDVVTGPGGEIYISDDKAGVVYLVTQS